jgi:hypothetical protein
MTIQLEQTFFVIAVVMVALIFWRTAPEQRPRAIWFVLAFLLVAYGLVKTFVPAGG